MIARWLDGRRKLGRLRQAEAIEDWLTSVNVILDTCATALRGREAPDDIGVTLDRIDRELMRFRNHAAEAAGPLRRRDRRLAGEVRSATDQAFHLRNLTCACLLRWQTYRQLDRSNPHSVGAQREVEEARLKATQAARELAAQLDAVRPDIRRFLDELHASG